MTASRAAHAPTVIPGPSASDVGRRVRAALSELGMLALVIGISPAALLLLWATRDVPAHEGDE
jgi:hypothetical protein